MARKRMFNITVVDSDAFLDMPLSTQCLYFHLNMRADDDGFIGNPKRIQRTIGASDDDFKILMAKRFVLVFDDGVIVIKHWRMHNTIQKDRYTPTVYQEELESLFIKENKAYSLNNNDMETKCIQNDNTDIDIDLDIDLDIEEDKDIYISEQTEVSLPAPVPSTPKKTKSKKEKPVKHKHGEFKHVLLTDEEVAKLYTKYGKQKTENAIKYLDIYIEEKGYKSRSHYIAIIRWVLDAVTPKQNKVQSNQNQSEPSFNNITKFNV